MECFSDIQLRICMHINLYPPGPRFSDEGGVGWGWGGAGWGGVGWGVLTFACMCTPR